MYRVHMHKKKAGYTFLHDAYVHVNRHWIENLHDTRTWYRIGNFYIAYVASSISNISTMIHRKVFTRSTNPFISPRASFPRGMEFFYSKDIDDSCAIPPTKYRSLGRKVKYLRANGEETLSMSLYKKRDVS